jgi:hypothetical protein
LGRLGSRRRASSIDCLDRGARALAQRVGLALDAREGAAGLLAGHHLGDRLIAGSSGVSIR